MSGKKSAAERLDPAITGIFWKLERVNGKENSTPIAIDEPGNYTLTPLPNGVYQARADCTWMQGYMIFKNGDSIYDNGPR